MAYTELYVSPIYWPDFREAQLMEALADYQRRERRFGKTAEQQAKEV
jgi:undecaprenyl diphosphate synthase